MAVTTAETTPVVPAEKMPEMSERVKQRYAALGAIFAAWVLGYYLVPNTFFARISPGGMAMAFVERQPPLLDFVATAIGLMLALFALATAESPIRKSYCPPLWLITAIWSVPLLLACKLTGQTGVYSLRAMSVLIALSTGIVAACIGRRQALVPISITAFLQAGYAIIYQKTHMAQLLSGNVLRAVGTFEHSDNLYCLMVMALPFAIVGGLRARGNFAKFAYLVVASAELAALAMTWSRAGALAVVGSIVVVCYLVTRSKRLTLFVLICLLPLSFVVHTVRSTGAANQRSIQGSNTGRMHEWSDGWNAFLAHPLTGIGVGAFHSFMRTHRGTEITVNGTDEPKNILLDWLAGRGIVGAVLFALFVWAIALRIRRALPDSVAIATAGAWVALLIVGQVDTPFGSPDRYAGNCSFGLLIGITALLTSPSCTDLPGSITANTVRLHAGTDQSDGSGTL